MSLSMVCDFNVLHLMLDINNLFGSNEWLLSISIAEKVILELNPPHPKTSRILQNSEHILESLLENERIKRNISRRRK
jgi:hypothetical protein